MGRSQRNKGARGELEACEALAGVWPNLQRGLTQTRGGGDCPDIDGEGVPYWIEVKRGKRAPHPSPAYEQAQRATDGRAPLVMSRADRGPWLVTINVETFKALVRGQSGQPSGNPGQFDLRATVRRIEAVLADALQSSGARKDPSPEG